MKLFYDTVPVHELGEFTVSQRREVEGAPDAPQRFKVVTTLVLNTFAASYSANAGLLAQLTAALAEQQAQVQWTDDNGRPYLNQPVTLVSANQPEEWGEYHQRAEVVFYHYEHNLTTQNLPCTFTAAGGSGYVFTNILHWKLADNTERVTPLQPHRRLTQERITVEGYILGDPQVPLAKRRDWLNTKAAALKRELTSAEGVLRLGDKGQFFQQTVRIENFTAEVDQLVYSLPFSFTAQWTPFGNAPDFAVTDLAVDEQTLPDGQNTGEQFLKLAGKVVAKNEATARAKLAELSAAVLTQYGYAAAQPVKDNAVANQVDAAADGRVFTELTFNREWRRWRSDNQAATFKATTNLDGGAVDMGQVRTQSLRYSAQRPNEHKSQRNFAGGRVELAGTFPADMTKSLAERRAALDAKVAQLYAQCNAADGELKYGTGFDKVVRVDDFHAEVNQKITGIEWNLSAHWSEFPADDGFATAEFTVTPRLAEEDGDEFIAFAGRIRSTTKAQALTKLAALRTSVLTTYGYTEAQRLRAELNYGSFYANGDQTAGLDEPIAQESAGTGTAFAELNFNEEYRRRRSDHVTWTMRVSSREDVAAGLAYTTYTGSVSASGDTVDAAYAAALAKAQALGANKQTTVGNNAFLRGSTVSWDERQANAANAVEFVRLEFAYEYQSKLGTGRVYYELATESQTNPFEVNTQTISGSITGATEAELDATYAAIKADLAGNGLSRGERTTKQRVFAGAENKTQLLRLEFAFTLYTLKPDGFVAYRYGLLVEKDYLQLTITRRLHGTVWATTADAATTAWAALVATLTLGTLVRESNEASFNFVKPDEAAMYERSDFDQTYVDRLTGVASVRELSLNEEVTYTAPRWVLLPTLVTPDNPDGLDVPQSFSTVSGSRRVRGEVTAATLTAAETWAKAQRGRLTGDVNGVKIFEPEQWERQTVFLPGTTTVQLYRVRFTFAERLVKYPAP